MPKASMRVVEIDGESWIGHADVVRWIGINQSVFLRAAVFGRVRVKIVGRKALYHLADLESLAAERAATRESDAAHRHAMRLAAEARRAKREARRAEKGGRSIA